MAVRVHFDQNCINAKGTDPELQQVQRLHDAGRIVLVANLRNRLELGHPYADGPGKKRLRARLAQFEETPETFRLDISPLDEAILGGIDDRGLNPIEVWQVVFPESPFPTAGEVFDSGQNSLHDVMHIVNAHDNRVDVFLTREKRLLAVNEKLRLQLGFYPTILSPAQLLAQVNGSKKS